jgi:hypothetical protein
MNRPAPEKMLGKRKFIPFVVSLSNHDRNKYNNYPNETPFDKLRANEAIY